MTYKVDLALKQGVVAHKEGNLKEAEKFYRLILESEPSHPDANHNLGILSLSLNRLDLALPLFETALEANPNIEQFWLSYIDALVKASRIDKAREALGMASQSGVCPEKLDVLGLQLKLVDSKKPITSQIPLESEKSNLIERYESGEYKIAMKLAKSMTNNYPAYEFGWKVLGAILFQSSEFNESLIAFEHAVDLVPSDEISHCNLGLALESLGRQEEAVACFKCAIQLNPKYAEACYNLGTSLSHLGRFEQALESYSQATKINPEYPEAFNSLGVVLNELGELERAEESYNRAIRIKSNFAQPHFNLGVLQASLGKLKLAEVSYKKAISLELDYVEAHYNLALLLNELGKLEQAEKSYLRVISLKPNWAEAYSGLGITLTALGKLDQAVENYKKAIFLAPLYAETYCNLGITLKRLDRLDSAKKSYEHAIELRPDYTAAHFNLGITLKELGELDRAVTSFKQAIHLEPDSAETHSNLGKVLNDLGRLGEAEALFLHALALKPGYLDAKYHLGLLLISTKRFAKAIEYLDSLDYRESNHYLLKCLYLQNKKELFYEQLDYLNHQGECHPIIGSLACRANLRYGISRTNLYCENPLDYLRTSDLNQVYDFKNEFVEPVKTILDGNRLPNKKQELLVNGYQTSGNIFLTEIDNIHSIQEAIRIEIGKYRSFYEDSKEGLVTRWPEEYHLFGWLISLKSGGELKPHMHEEGWISGSIYINVPKKRQADSGNLVICVDEDQPDHSNDKQVRSIDVRTGYLCLFPSSLMHYTVPFYSNEERIVLAFDVVPN